MTATIIPVRWETKNFEVAIVSRNEAKAENNNDCRLRSGKSPSRVKPFAASRDACYIATSFGTVLLVSLLLGGLLSLNAADFVITADLSGSMATPVKGKGGRSRNAVVQEALIDYVNALPKESRLKVITFNDGFAEREVILRSNADRAELIRWIGDFGQEVRLNRGTRLYDAMRRALTAARDYARGNPHQYVEVRILTDGEDSSGVPADRAIPEILREFPEVDGQSIRVDLVLAGDWSSAMIIRLEEKLRPLGMDVTDAGDFSQPLLPPVIVQAPAPTRVGQETLFADNSTTAFLGYEWVLNGRSAGKEKSLKVTFDSSGTNSLELVGITARGQRLRTRQFVAVEMAKLTAEIAFFPVTPRVGDEIQFLARVSGDATRFDWFADGKLRSQDRDFSTRFDVATTHGIRLVVRNGAGVSVEATQKVTIIARELHVDFTAPSEVVAGAAVQFANETPGDNLTFIWSLGDGQTSKDRNPRHVYQLASADAESFDVKLSATDPTGLTVDSPVRRIRVTAPKREVPPVAGFRVEGSLWKVGIPVELIDESKGLVREYRYECDGEGTATNKNPAFTFRSPGPKCIVQHVQGPGGEAWATNRIAVQPLYALPAIVTASVSPTNGRAPLKCEFKATISGDVETVCWLIGRSVISTNLHFTHSFESGCDELVSLIVKPKQPGAPPLSQVWHLTLSPRLPFWRKLLPVVGFLAIIGGMVGWKLRPQRLLGELSWEYAGQRGRATLTGTRLNLSALKIPGWNPNHQFVVRNRNGHRILSEDGVSTELAHKKSVRLDGVTFTYLNEAEAL